MRILFTVCFLVSAPFSAFSFDNLPSLYEKAKASVVTLSAIDAKGRPLNTGTGFFVADGYKVVTNYHVIKGATTIVIRFLDGTTVSTSELFAASPANDLALLKCSIKGPPLQLAPEGIAVGDEIAVIGSPLGLEGSLTVGVVSSLRELPTMLAYQTTAAISPGNSGGPAIDKKGQVAGITTFSMTGGQSLNFAIHCSYVLPLLAHTVTHPIVDGWSHGEVKAPEGTAKPALTNKIIYKGTRIVPSGLAEVTLRNNSTVAVTNIEGDIVCYKIVKTTRDSVTLSKSPAAILPFKLLDTIGPTSEYSVRFVYKELIGHEFDSPEPWVISEVRIQAAKEAE